MVRKLETVLTRDGRFTGRLTFLLQLSYIYTQLWELYIIYFKITTFYKDYLSIYQLMNIKSFIVNILQTRMVYFV